jgi:hypothetical protein
VNLSPETTNGSVGEAENPKNLSPGPISDVDILLSAAAGRFFIPTGCGSVHARPYFGSEAPELGTDAQPVGIKKPNLGNKTFLL